MARIRTVKPELFKHVGLFEAEIAYQLPIRLAFVALFTCCDRRGRFRWDPRRLKLDILPYDDVDASRVLDALVTRGFVVKYEHKNETFGCIPSWHKHQQINHREMESEIPPLEDSLTFVTEKTNKNNEVKMHDAPVLDACLTREPPVKQSLGVCPGGIWNRERNMEGNRERKETIVASETRLSDIDHPTQQIFLHWKSVMNHPNAKLDQKRKVVIIKALKSGYGIEQLCEAITGCSYTPHNMGDNERGQRYDGLHVILRDGDQIDRFMHNYHYPPRPISDAERKTQENVQSLQRWVDQKMQEECIHASS